MPTNKIKLSPKGQDIRKKYHKMIDDVWLKGDAKLAIEMLLTVHGTQDVAKAAKLMKKAKKILAKKGPIKPTNVLDLLKK
jgi:hypothetical protein